MEAFLISTGIVAIAEIGDKTQLLALMLAAKYRRPLPIILGIFVATIVNHAGAAAFGAWIASLLGPDMLRWGLAASFIAMGGWMLVPDKAGEDAPLQSSHLGVFLSTTAAFFLVEMGDKTQIAAIALAARFNSLWNVAAGATAGMMIANIPAVLLGEAAARALPMGIVRAVSALSFVGLGAALLIDIIPGFQS